MNFKRQFCLLIFGFIIIVSLVGGVLFMWDSETKEMENQEVIGEQLADEYLLSISESDIIFSEDEESPMEPLEDELDYNDNELLGSYSESQAVGSLDCVLEIPAIELRQSVFTGTPSQIRKNLSRWMSVTGRSDYILGSTHYCIYMHNPTVKEIRISYAQETLVPGDYILLTKDNTVFFYEMTRMFPEWRQTATELYTDNMSLGPEWVYIQTCARREWQGRNLVIEGKLYETYDLDDWKENSEEYIAQYKGYYAEVSSQKTQESLSMNITHETEGLKISVTRPDKTQALHCSIGLFDSDGYIQGNDHKYTGTPLILDLDEGEYIIGIYENNTEYISPMPFKVNLKKNNTQIGTIDQVEEEIENEGNMIMQVAICLLAVFSIMYFVLLFKTIRSYVHYNAKNKQ